MTDMYTPFPTIHDISGDQKKKKNSNLNSDSGPVAIGNISPAIHVHASNKEHRTSSRS